MKTKNGYPRQKSRTFALALAAFLVCAGFGCGHTHMGRSPKNSLGQALTFYASFDGSTDAEFAKGNAQIHWMASMKHPRVGQPGLPPNGVVTHAPGEGRYGDALRFERKAPEVVFFQAKENVAYQTRNWSGTVSLWLRLDPATQLAMGYCDPIQITPRDWNDASFFVEFEKRTNSIPFRLGAYADLKIWNPEGRDWGKIPFEEKPLVHIHEPPFAGDQWTHVAFTFENFNSGQKDGIARLYLNGKPHGFLSPREQTYTWDLDKTLVMLGLSYAGLYDEVAIFNRALTEREIAKLYALPSGVRSILDPLRLRRAEARR